MPDTKPDPSAMLADVARRHGVAPEAAWAVLRALAATGGRMAQFDHPDLGGMGQWSQGGMVMVGDMFDQDLKRRVDALCTELAGLLPQVDVAGPGGDAAGTTRWWPAGLGDPSASGAQGELRYAWFAAARRLAIQRDGHVTLYDTGDHRITGVSQQSGARHPSFTTDRGDLVVDDLRRLDSSQVAARAIDAQTTDVRTAEARSADARAADGRTTDAQAAGAQAASARVADARAQPARPVDEQPARSPADETNQADLSGGAASARASARLAQSASPEGADPLDLIERLAGLHAKGILSDDEFAAKKKELLGRL